MSQINHLWDNDWEIVVCKSCGRKYKQWQEDQVPGFRDVEYDYCPYCHEVNGQSMEVDFINRKVGE